MNPSSVKLSMVLVELIYSKQFKENDTKDNTSVYTSSSTELNRQVDNELSNITGELLTVVHVYAGKSISYTGKLTAQITV